MQKLTIVVNCTERKSVAPTSDLRMRSLPAGDSNRRFEAWRSRVASAKPHVALAELYQGEAWLQAKGLAADARARGTHVRMLVASAGLGLKDVTHPAPSYAATFASGHADSVSDDVKRMSQWWAHLSDMPNVASLPAVADDPVLLVLSESYARAMDADLSALARRGGDYLMIGGWRPVEGLPRLPADRNLRHALGGTVSSVSLRMARTWMDKRTVTTLYSQSDADCWSRWANRVHRSEQYQRAALTDGDVSELIKTLIRDEPGLSASRALRIVRDRGMACEQKRFRALFRDAVGLR